MGWWCAYSINDEVLRHVAARYEAIGCSVKSSSRRRSTHSRDSIVVRAGRRKVFSLSPRFGEDPTLWTLWGSYAHHPVMRSEGAVQVKYFERDYEYGTGNSPQEDSDITEYRCYLNDAEQWFKRSPLWSPVCFHWFGTKPMYISQSLVKSHRSFVVAMAESEKGSYWSVWYHPCTVLRTTATPPDNWQQIVEYGLLPMAEQPSARVIEAGPWPLL